MCSVPHTKKWRIFFVLFCLSKLVAILNWNICLTLICGILSRQKKVYTICLHQVCCHRQVKLWFFFVPIQKLHWTVVKKPYDLPFFPNAIDSMNWNHTRLFLLRDFCEAFQLICNNFFFVCFEYFDLFRCVFGNRRNSFARQLGLVRHYCYHMMH